MFDKLSFILLLNKFLKKNITSEIIDLNKKNTKKMYTNVILFISTSMLNILKMLISNFSSFEENKLIIGSISEKVRNSKKDKKSAKIARKNIRFFCDLFNKKNISLIAVIKIYYPNLK